MLRRYSCVAGLPVPITRAPRCTANWTAALPMLPDAPLISTVLPRHPQLVQCACGCLNRRGQRRRGSEVHRGWNADPGREHRQLGLRRPAAAEPDHLITNLDYPSPTS